MIMLISAADDHNPRLPASERAVSVIDCISRGAPGNITVLSVPSSGHFPVNTASDDRPGCLLTTRISYVPMFPFPEPLPLSCNV